MPEPPRGGSLVGGGGSPPVEGSGSEGTLSGGVWTGPTLTEGTLTWGVEEGVGTLVPPGRSIAAGTTATVADATDRQASAAPVAATASMALRRIPAGFTPEYPAAGTVPGGPRGCRGSTANYTF